MTVQFLIAKMACPKCENNWTCQ